MTLPSSFVILVKFISLWHFVLIIGYWACISRYGYVTPDDVSILLEQHIGKGEIVDRLWRYFCFVAYLLCSTSNVSFALDIDIV